MIHYIECGQERRWRDDLRNGRSMIIVGERGSGLSTAVDQILGGLTGRTIIRVSARLLSGGTQFLSDLAYECVRSRFGTKPSEDVEQLVMQLRADFRHVNIVDLLERIRVDRHAPLVIIDRFECLAVKLQPDAWASVRDLLEKKLLQLVLLSRLSIPEVEKLANSKFGQTIKQEVLSPLFETDKRRALALLRFDKSVVPDEILDYIGELAGGHRSLTLFLAEKIAEHLQHPSSVNSFIDQVIAAHRDEIRAHLVDSFRALEPSADGLHNELEAELRCAFDVDHAPGFVIGILSFPLQRLRRLGHLQLETGRPACFSSELLRSELRRRWFRLRQDSGVGYSEWLEYDELLRKLVRSRLSAHEVLVRVKQTCAATVELWERDSLWWGTHSGDILDALDATDLHRILMDSPSPLGADWREQWLIDLNLVSAARRPITSVAWEMWLPERRIAAERALERLREFFSSMLFDEKPSDYLAEHVRSAPAERIVRWLHISDAHFHRDRPYGENMVVNSFLSTLRQQRGLPADRQLGPSPDLVFFTGDIAYSGLSEEYDRARLFFDELLELLGLDRDRLFFVPGNHDVDRVATRYLERSPRNSEAAHKAFQDHRWQRLYAERLSAYTEFNRSYFENVPQRLRTTPRGFLAPQRLQIRDIDIVIHLLNSQWCGGLPDDSGNLVFGLSLLHEELESEFGNELDADLRLALMHQPLNYLAEFEQQSFLLLGRHLDAALRGHLHRSEVVQAVTTRGDLTEFSAGALFSDPEHDNAAQFVELEVDSRFFTVYPIRFEPKQFRWERDTSLGEAPNYTFCGHLRPRALRRKK